MKSLKERTYEIEDAFFSPYACKSKDTSGREREETPCGMRTEFQRDRDRVIYSKYAGTEVKLDGEEFIVVKQSDILAVVE